MLKRTSSGRVPLRPYSQAADKDSIPRVPSLLALLVQHESKRWRLVSLLLLVLLSMLCLLNVVWAGQWWLAGALPFGIHRQQQQPQQLGPRSMLASVQVHDASSDANHQAATYIVNATLMNDRNSGVDGTSADSDAMLVGAMGAAAVQAQVSQDKSRVQATTSTGSRKDLARLETGSADAADTKQKEQPTETNTKQKEDSTDAAQDKEEEHTPEVDEAKKLAELYPPEVLPHSPDECAAALGAPKVALLFLTKGKLWHDPSWRAWFASASNRVPFEFACAGNATMEDLAACAPRPGSSPIANQHLFNVYVHAPPGVSDEEVGGMWSSHLVQHRIQPEWGTHSLVHATRNLLWEAFRDPANQRFVLLSESDIPIWDPLTFYRQLMSEDKSRVNGWPHDHTDVRRWTWHMATGDARIHRSDWRKSSQWFGMLRKHVQTVLEDTAVFRSFEAHCWNGWDGDYRRWRDCFSDEHYLSTLLAHSGASEETVPSMSGVAAVDWSRGGPHPYSYLPDDIHPALVKDKLRTGEGCGNEGHDRLQAAAWRTFVAADEVDADSAVCEVAREEQEAEGGFEPLAPVCSLTARKFGEDTTQLVLITLMLDCDDDGVRLTRPDVCTAMRTELSDGGDGWFGWRW